MMTTMLRILLILVSVATMGMMVRKIRQAKVQIEDSIFWILLSMLLVVFSIFPAVADGLASCWESTLLLISCSSLQYFYCW